MTREEFQKTVSERFKNTESGFGNMTQRELILLQIASNVHDGAVDVSGSAFDIEELHTLHSGLITAKTHLNKRTKGYMMVVAMVEKLSYLIREHYR